MFVIIAGSRHYPHKYLLPHHDQALKRLMKDLPITKVISGGALGIDTLAVQWAIKNKLPYEIVMADWKKHGKKAGFLRNTAMAEMGQAVILFPGGVGTKLMERIALKHGLPTFTVTCVQHKAGHDGDLDSAYSARIDRIN